MAPRAGWSSFSEQLVVLLALLWFGLHLKLPFNSADETPRIVLTNSALIQEILLKLGTTQILLMLLVSAGHQPLSCFGVKWHRWRQSISDGWAGFLLAVVPMAITMTLVVPLRTPESQNALLRLLAINRDPMTLGLIAFIATVVAPLSEEFVFRVILQGWLTTKMPARIAVPIVAIAFASVHGLVDGLALIPLALILGYVFHQRHNFLTVVVIHGLFNATMLALSLLTLS